MLIGGTHNRIIDVSDVQYIACTCMLYQKAVEIYDMCTKDKRTGATTDAEGGIRPGEFINN